MGDRVESDLKERPEEQWVPLNLLVNREQRDSLRRIARSRQLPVSGVVREVIRAFLATDAAREEAVAA